MGNHLFKFSAYQQNFCFRHSFQFHALYLGQNVPRVIMQIGSFSHPELCIEVDFAKSHGKKKILFQPNPRTMSFYLPHICITERVTQMTQGRTKKICTKMTFHFCKFKEQLAASLDNIESKPP